MIAIKVLVATILIGSALSALTSRWRKLCSSIALISSLIISVTLFAVAIRVFSRGALVIAEPLFSIPVIGANLLVSIDALSALFLLVIGLITFLATLFSFSYMEKYIEQDLSRFYPFLLLFIGGMIGVVVVSDLFFFIVFWEFMTLTSYILVVFEKEKAEVLRAGFKYFLMTHIGTACIFVSAVVLQAQTDSFSFSALQEAFGSLITANPLLLYVILALFLIGFGTKAGMYPLGTWLPDAHPAAPSGVSSILSGVMIKMGIYGILRVFLFLLPVSSHSLVWGIIIATFGAISMIMGTLCALIQKDSKRLLAFHSIGQIGYILLGVGIGVALLKSNPALAAIAIIAGVYHLINHACFKGLLFLNAGSILYKTGSRDLNKVGGLWKIMPLTTVTALIASLSIAGIPPFNGFASKWLIYQVSILGGIKMPLFVLYGVIAIFICVVTLASFMKFLGTAFVGKPAESIETRGQKSEESEVPFSMRLPQIILASFCIVLGLVPLTPLILVYSTLFNSQLGLSLPSFSALFGENLNGVAPMIEGTAVGIFRPALITLVFAICLIFAYLISRLGGAKRRAVPLWYCGEEYKPDSVRYKATSFYLPIETLFERWVFPKITYPEVGRPERIYRGLDFDRLFYYPFVSLLIRMTNKFRKTHVGIPQTYMLWQVIGVFVVILILFLMGR